jgi:uncharacterized protein YndB with AHSA1/START domain
MKWVLYIVAGLGGLVALLALVGAMLPKGHRASVTTTYAAAPAAVFALIADVGQYASWRADVTKIELLPDDGRGTLFREHGENGPILYRVEASTPPTLMRTRIADTSLAFGGTWTYDLAPSSPGSPTGTTLTITEDGEVYNVIFRVLGKFFFSPTASMEKYQAALRKRLGE